MTQWTPVTECELEHLQVPPLGSYRACREIPRTAVDPRFLQHIRATRFGDGGAREYGPRTILRTRPVEQGDAHDHVMHRGFRGCDSHGVLPSLADALRHNVRNVDRGKHGVQRVGVQEVERVL